MDKPWTEYLQTHPIHYPPDEELVVGYGASILSGRDVLLSQSLRRMKSICSALAGAR